MKYTYLLINLCTIAFPLVWSFEKNMFFFRQWKHAFAAILLTSFIFVPWDMLFTYMNVWAFNPAHLSGVHIGNLPIEECLFFITVPFASMFIYASLDFLLKEAPLKKHAKKIAVALGAVLLVVALLNFNRWHTLISFTFAALLLLLHAWVLKSSYLGTFFLAFLIIQVPSLLVNGMLAGMLLDEPVIWYNPGAITGWRMITIPVEDTAYGLTLVLLNITFYESFKSGRIRLFSSSRLSA